jgi:hypothetical protein
MKFARFHHKGEPCGIIKKVIADDRGVEGGPAYRNGRFSTAICRVLFDMPETGSASGRKTHQRPPLGQGRAGARRANMISESAKVPAMARRHKLTASDFIGLGGAHNIADGKQRLRERDARAALDTRTEL